MSSVWEGTKTEAFVKGVELGAERERERIVALLKDNTCPSCELGYALHTGCEGNLDAIALIKGVD